MLILFFHLQALYSLKRYPMPLRTGKEAKILDNFGDKICKMLDNKLEKHIAENGNLASVCVRSLCFVFPLAAGNVTI